jgi:hypothetical protein
LSCGQGYAVRELPLGVIKLGPRDLEFTGIIGEFEESAFEFVVRDIGPRLATGILDLSRS